MIFKRRNSVTKIITLSGWLIVGTIMLAHAIVPHHHHDGISCISYTHHDTSAQHSGESHENCLLMKVYLIWSKDKQMHQLHYFDFTPLPCQVILFFDDFTCRIIDDFGLLFGQKPYLLPNYTTIIARSSGLRAPPVY